MVSLLSNIWKNFENPPRIFCLNVGLSVLKERAITFDKSLFLTNLILHCHANDDNKHIVLILALEWQFVKSKF